MADITIFMKDGTIREFKQEHRPGGSYSNVIDYKPGFVMITDVWGKRVSLPAEDIKEIQEEPGSRRF